VAIQFRLPEDVRNKYELPEWVSYDPNVMMIDEAIALDDELGIDPNELNDRLRTPKGERRDWRAWKYVIWLAVHRAGADVSYADFDLDLYALTAASDSPQAADDPKAETDDPSIPESLSGESEAESVTS